MNHKHTWSIVAKSLVVGLLCWLVLACSSTSNITIQAEGAAEISLDLQIHPLFATYVRDLQETLGVGKDLFNLKELQNRLATEPGTTVQLVQAKDNNLKLKLSIQSLSALASQKSVLREMFSLTKDGADQVLRVRLSQKSIQSIFSLFSPAKGNTLESVLPSSKVMNPQKYEEQLLWALEDYGKKAELQTMLRTAKIATSVTLPLPPKSVTGGRKSDANPRVVVFEIGVLELMTLSTERVYEIRY